jgi:hypothetical protein
MNNSMIKNNTMIKLLAVVGGLLLMSPLAFAGSEPAPPSNDYVDGTPVIKRAKLSIVPAVGVCGGGVSDELGIITNDTYSGVDCIFGDLTIAGTCEGLPVIASVRGFPLAGFGLDISIEDITDITKEGLLGNVIEEKLGSMFNEQNPELNNDCKVIEFATFGRDYEIRRVKHFVNKAGVISAEIHLVPQDVVP